MRRRSPARPFQTQIVCEQSKRRSVRLAYLGTETPTKSHLEAYGALLCEIGTYCLDIVCFAKFLPAY